MSFIYVFCVIWHINIINFISKAVFLVFLFQEMFDILKSIYDLMGKSIHPRLKEEVVRQHVRMFFQVMLLYKRPNC